MSRVEVLVPTCERPEALAVTLAGLAGQDERDFGVIVSDQSLEPVADSPEVAAMLRVLRHQGRPVGVHRHLPRRGVAEHRQFLLERASAPYVLFLDDDVYLEPE
ncbi:MAG: glycosyltransferase family 2 protein, partial [Actinomycetota bacterium]|nr:glycosyltransferase family 2 protein [Actinomycetota bacterium]